MTAPGSSLRKQQALMLYARELSRRTASIRPRPSRAWLVGTAKALRSWWYWQSREGAARRRECAAIDDILRLVEPNYREMVERIIKRNIVRPCAWWDVPRRWRR